MADISNIDEELLRAASETMDKAHVLWGFKVGAAVLAQNEKVYGGCNVESWVSGLGICAERNAINHAVLHGNKKIKRIAVVMDSQEKREPVPCGVCLQYIHDFAENSRVRIIMAKTKNGKVLNNTGQSRSIRELLPFPYRQQAALI